LFVHPSSRLIFVVWSKSTVTGYDLVLSRFAGGAWQPFEVVSNGPEDEFDPQVAFGPDGKIHLVYWTQDANDGAGVVRYREAPANLGSWSLPQRVSFSDESARRPSIAIHQAMIKVGYEAWPTGSLDPASRDVVIASRELAANGWMPEWVAATGYSGALWTGLHAKGDELWVEWIDAETGPVSGEMAWRELGSDGSWTPITLEPFGNEEEYEFRVRENIRWEAQFGPSHPGGNDPPELE
ncbi:MAG: hypothetical protein OER88_08725, partial [Planctomycetota bacterium]|nr:hypothetical protein [Planctomycetota bacterium]